jgi:hypothetical protein
MYVRLSLVPDTRDLRIPYEGVPLTTPPRDFAVAPAPTK